MKRTFSRGERVVVPYGIESRIIATIDSGPYRYTYEELEENKRINEYHGYSTKRMPKTYYLLRPRGRAATLVCAITSIQRLSKPR